MSPFDPADFCKAAHRVVVVGEALEGEAAWRTAASRAYYAVWLATRAALRLKQNDRALDPGHAYLWDELKSARHPTDIQELGNQGAELHKWRKYADYEPGVVFDKGMAEKRAKQCHEALKLLDAVKSRLPQVQQKPR